MRRAIIILGHGSRSEGADETIRRVVAEVKKLSGYDIVEPAFLQYDDRTPQDALERCIRQKAGKIVMVPFFMQLGAHVTRDIPDLVKRAKKKYPGIDIIVTDHAGAHPLMAKIVVDLVEKGGSEYGARTAE